MSKQELSKHAGRQTSSLQQTVVEGPPSCQDKQQIKDGAVLITVSTRNMEEGCSSWLKTPQTLKEGCSQNSIWFEKNKNTDIYRTLSHYIHNTCNCL